MGLGLICRCSAAPVGVIAHRIQRCELHLHGSPMRIIGERSLQTAGMQPQILDAFRRLNVFDLISRTVGISLGEIGDVVCNSGSVDIDVHRAKTRNVACVSTVYPTVQIERTLRGRPVGIEGVIALLCNGCAALDLRSARGSGVPAVEGISVPGGRRQSVQRGISLEGRVRRLVGAEPGSGQGHTGGAAGAAVGVEGDRSVRVPDIADVGIIIGIIIGVHMAVIICLFRAAHSIGHPFPVGIDRVVPCGRITAEGAAPYRHGYPLDGAIVAGCHGDGEARGRDVGDGDAADCRICYVRLNGAIQILKKPDFSGCQIDSSYPYLHVSAVRGVKCIRKAMIITAAVCAVEVGLLQIGSGLANEDTIVNFYMDLQFRADILRVEGPAADPDLARAGRSRLVHCDLDVVVAGRSVATAVILDEIYTARPIG